MLALTASTSPPPLFSHILATHKHQAVPLSAAGVQTWVHFNGTGGTTWTCEMELLGPRALDEKLEDAFQFEARDAEIDEAGDEAGAEEDKKKEAR